MAALHSRTLSPAFASTSPLLLHWISHSFDSERHWEMVGWKRGHCSLDFFGANGQMFLRLLTAVTHLCNCASNTQSLTSHTNKTKKYHANITDMAEVLFKLLMAAR